MCRQYDRRKTRSEVRLKSLFLECTYRNTVMSVPLIAMHFSISSHTHQTQSSSTCYTPW